MFVTVNDFYFVGERLIGRVGENDLGIIKGRFTSVVVNKRIDGAVYDEAGIKYRLGTEGEAPTFEVLKEKIFELTFRCSGSVSGIGAVFKMANKILGSNSNFNLDLISTVNYKTRLVQKWKFKCLGRELLLEQTYFPNRETYDLQLCK